MCWRATPNAAWAVLYWLGFPIWTRRKVKADHLDVSIVVHCSIVVSDCSELPPDIPFVRRTSHASCNSSYLQEDVDMVTLASLM